MDKKDLYLFALQKEELTEIYEALSLRYETLKRLREQSGLPKQPPSPLFLKISNQFSEKTAGQLKDQIIDSLDEYLDNQVNDELMWQKIEDELRDAFGDK